MKTAIRAHMFALALVVTSLNSIPASAGLIQQNFNGGISPTFPEMYTFDAFDTSLGRLTSVFLSVRASITIDTNLLGCMVGDQSCSIDNGVAVSWFNGAMDVMVSGRVSTGTSSSPDPGTIHTLFAIVNQNYDERGFDLSAFETSQTTVSWPDAFFARGNIFISPTVDVEGFLQYRFDPATVPVPSTLATVMVGLFLLRRRAWSCTFSNQARGT